LQDHKKTPFAMKGRSPPKTDHAARKFFSEAHKDSSLVREDEHTMNGIANFDRYDEKSKSLS